MAMDPLALACRWAEENADYNWMLQTARCETPHSVWVEVVQLMDAAKLTGADSAQVCDMVRELLPCPSVDTDPYTQHVTMNPLPSLSWVPKKR